MPWQSSCSQSWCVTNQTLLLRDSIQYYWPGYGTMTASMSVAKDWSRVIQKHVVHYNELVDQMDHSSWPCWFPEAMIHTKLDVKELLNLSPEDNWWNKMWQNVWSSSWMLLKEPPLFLMDPLIRKGIVVVLTLDWIAECKWLAWEELNACIWVVETVDSLITVANEIHHM